MSPKRKGGAAAKPPAQPSKPAPTTSKPSPPSASKPSVTFAAAPQTAPARPSQPSAATSSAQRVSPQPQAGPSRPSVTINPNPVAAPPRAPAQPPKPTAQPAKSAFASHSRPGPAPAARTAVPPSRTFTRSDRVRAEWREFQEKWVAVYQRQIEKELDELFRTAERTSRKGSPPSGMDKIVNSMQRDFALAARAEWDARLERAHLQAEDWTDMTLQEMIEVEQVLSYEEPDDEPGAFAQAQARAAAASQPTASKKPNAAQPLHNTQPVASRYSPPAAAPEQLKKQASGRGSQAAAEDARFQHKMSSSPSPASTTARAMPTATKPAQASAPLPATSPEFLTYAVPVYLAMPPLDASLLGNTEYMAIVYKLHFNSISQFHMKAATADTELAMQLCKPMPAADREFTIRAHLMAMEQSAREIVKRRDQLLEEERKRRGLGGGGSGDGDSAPPPPATVPPRSQAPAQVPTQAGTRAPQQPPGAFPEERAQPATRRTELPLDPEPILEYVPDGGAAQEPEPEPEVEEVIEIPIKGKGKKKGKKAAVVETKLTAATTPAPAVSSAGRAAISATLPTTEGKGKGKVVAPVLAAVDAVKSATARAPSPAPINTKLAASASADGRGSPAGSARPSSPWGMSQADAARAERQLLLDQALARAAEEKARAAEEEAKARAAEASSGQNSFWAPPMGRSSSNSKNPFAPSRPSRLAQVTQAHDREPVPQSPESPEPPSPPPREPTGRDYVAWFAGSSSEDEEGGSGNPLDEDEDDEDEEEEAPAGLGGLLASLAGGSPWAMFGGESGQPQRARAASPARARGATPTPARFTPAPQAEPAYARWGMPSTAGPSGLAAGPSAGPSGPPGMWKEEGDDLEQMLEIASSALDHAATGRGRHGVDIEQAMNMYVTAAKARETLATPVGGRSAWRR